MKKTILNLALMSFLALMGGIHGSTAAAQSVGEPITIRFVSAKGTSLVKTNSTQGTVLLKGTGSAATIVVESKGLEQDVSLTTTSGFSVTPSIIKADSDPVTVTVTNLTTLSNNTGRLILRSGDIRTYVSLQSTGTPLEVKDISANPVYAGGSDAGKTFDGFTTAPNGYTVEFKAKVDDASQTFKPFAITSDKNGFEGYITSTGMGLMNSSDVFVSKKGISNPANGGTFYNTDGLYHTYRYAVTPDRRVFVYRDGMAIDTMRVADLALQPDWSVENGDVEANLIKNPGFEGEHNFSKSKNITDKIEGWDVYPYDQYNSTQDIVSDERSNDVDQNNHALQMQRYKWNDGWSAGQVSQIVDVAPNETYSFSALARGGINSDGTQLASLRIEDLQNADNKVTIPVTSDNYQTYAADFSTLANTKQVRVICYLERDKWGATVSDFRIDDVKLTGVSRNVKPQIGFINDGADVKYFAYDATGAYAPAFARLAASADSITIDGTGSSTAFDVTMANLTGNVQVSATSGLEVSPTVIKLGATTSQVTVKNISTLNHGTGEVILRSGDERAYVHVTTTGTPLEVKDISANPVYAGGSDAGKTFDGFTTAPNGYTVEFKAKVDDASQTFKPFAITSDKNGFEGYITSTGMGLMNSSDVFVSKKGISNPANGGTFYNTDGLYHTYRYAVTPDRRVFVYRDGMAIDTMRVADLALLPDWSVENGDVEANLIKNPGFEGEHNFSKSKNITDKIEGWDVYPYDQYNSTQDIVSDERSSDVDQNNHALQMQRYKWNDGWSAGQVSQIVDVAPNETYSFSALARGGIKSDGTQLASLRIEDLQNADNKVTIPVTSDNYQTYAADFSTLANTKQVRVICYLERAKWGATVSDFRIDDVKLTGVSRNVKPQIGFINEGADVKYFAYDATGAYAPAFARLAASADSITIDGTGSSTAFDVTMANLTGDVQVSATSGLKVSPTVIKLGATTSQVTVKNISTLNHGTGEVILRSGDERAYVHVTTTGTPLEVKDISANPVYAGGNDAGKTFDGFTTAPNGYTVELKAKVDDASQTFKPFAITSDKNGFEGYITSTGMGLMNSSDVFVSKKGISNPANGGTFYNTDGLYHTYRYAVTPDRRVFVYRDGMAIDTMRVADLALQPDWSVENGDVEANLIKNPGFEGEHNFSKSKNITDKIEGWDVYPYDQYNSTQDIVSDERSNDVDQNNHALQMQRYKWSDGWSAGQVSQIVDVAPNETYSFSALARGGIKSDGTQLASLRIEDLQNADNKVTIPVTSDNYQTYAADFSTLANTKQVRVICYLERDKWGATVSDFRIDDVKLTGVSRNVKPQIGFINEGADVKYFAYDATGAYAPAFALLSASADSLTLIGTRAEQQFTVTNANLSQDITVSATSGFGVSPTVIKAGSGPTEVTVTNLTTLLHNTGKVILRSGDLRTYVHLGSTGTALDAKDISTNPVYHGGTDEAMTFDGFNPGSHGFSVEVRAKVDDASQELRPFAIAADKIGFKGYITSTGMGLMNSCDVFVSKKGISNPANGGTFYNTDGLYHTYRYAVTPDNRIFVYRDGLPVDTMRVADLALQPDWSVENGEPVRNLIKNPGFEGEHNFSKSKNITDKIEGWDVYPYDQYNSTQDIVSDERSNDVDQNNHALQMQRYKWNDGWSAGQVSQIVDVAPNEVYSFSALARGGIKSDGTQLGSLRIEDLQNADNKVTIPVTSDNYQTYSADFSTLANTKQVRVICCLERAKWGATVSALRVDDVKLTGYSRVVKQQIGFDNTGADIKYFAFDNTGAYAPVMPGLTAREVSDAIRNISAEGGSLKVSVTNNNLVVYNATHHRVEVYNVAGKVVSTVPDYTDGTVIALPGQGVYIVATFSNGNRSVTKIVNR